MGLLTDPSAKPSKLTKILTKNNMKINVILYIGGLIGFCLLAHPAVNYRNYFSENALLPGLVHSDFREENDAKLYYEELLDEIKKYEDSVPYPWLLAKFKQIGLETYVHNFTLNYPLKESKKFHGQNIYAIFRAPRAASTESLVLSVPYRPPSSVHLTTTPSIAVMLAFAKFATRGNYWSKDLIFLITEHEQLGAQAWVEAYHGITGGKEGVLDHGDLKGRAGAIQAAINLELHDVNLKNIDVKVLGLNGQLPNLDLLNLANRLCTKEKIVHTFRGKRNRYNSDHEQFKHWRYSFETMMSMVFSQVTGVPDGNHGLFHRVGIQALTLEGFSSSQNGRTDFLVLGQLVEHIFRSLNNLLEKLHQSYFFYLLPDSMRFVSIGVYTPVLCTMAATLILKAAGIWYSEIIKEYEKFRKKQDNLKERERRKENEEFYKAASQEEVDEEKIDVVGLGMVIIMSHVFGVLVTASPSYSLALSSYFGYNYSTEYIIYWAFVFISLVLLFFPLYGRDMRTNGSTMRMLNMLASLELGAIIICLLIINVSFGIILILFWLPVALFVNPTNSRVHFFLQKLLWLFLHPLVAITISAIIYAFIMFPEEVFQENFNRGLVAAQQAIVFGIVDSMVYGNWFFNIIMTVFFPIWLLFWYSAFAWPVPKAAKVTKEKKTD